MNEALSDRVQFFGKCLSDTQKKYFSLFTFRWNIAQGQSKKGLEMRWIKKTSLLTTKPITRGKKQKPRTLKYKKMTSESLGNPLQERILEIGCEVRQSEIKKEMSDTIDSAVVDKNWVI